MTSEGAVYQLDVEEELRRNYDTQAAINSLLRLSLEDVNLNEILRHALHLILSIPWLSFESRGSIFLVEDDPEVLVMKVQSGISEPLLKECAEVAFGRCLCGQAALRGQIQFAECLDHRHEVLYEGIYPHGHYCIPICSHGRTLGVINVYLKEGHRYDQREVEFLAAMANTLAGIIMRKRAEKELRELNQELERRILDRTEQLEESNKELEAFVYSVSHDLRSPLTVIGGFARLLLQRYSSHLDAEGQRFLKIIRTKIGDMFRLIEDLLALSQVKHRPMELSSVDMAELSRAVFEELESAISEQLPQLTVKMLPHAYGDRAMIRQVFVNLLSNAVKFTKNKSVPIIEVGGWAEDSQNVYYVKDNGAGFDMEDADKLFDAFQRLHHSEEFDGTGVGLSIVQRIIQRHGGRVWAEGGVHEGATFYFTLPVVAHPDRKVPENSVERGE
jgi:two-component system sensor kinase